MTNYTEEQQADILETYLESLESGKAFELPTELLQDPELLKTAKLAKLLKVNGQASYPSGKLLNNHSKPEASQKISKLSWKWLTAIPAIGAVSVFAVAFWVTQFVPATNPQLTEQDIATMETQLVLLEELDTDLEDALAELDATVSETEELLNSDTYDEMILALNTSEL